MARVVLAMSGGVDSSVAAHLLLEQGHDVIGVFMRHGEESAESCEVNDGSSNPLLPLLQQRPDHKQGCCSASDAEDARRVADRLDIPFYALNLQKDFRRIVDYFVEEYTVGRTPNPCVMCNNWIKFGRLFDYADSVNAEFVATGHYARLESNEDGHVLCRGVDTSKDQSYVLFGIEREYLTRMMLPVGGYKKTAIREMAQGIGLRVADKKDSQEICFVTSGQHGEFVKARRGGSDLSGNIVTTAGDIVGQHDGIERFTIGQRKGLGVALGEPHFVVKIEPDTQDVIIGKHEDLACHELTANQTNWLRDPDLDSFQCLAQIRYNSQPVPATATITGDDQLHISFEQPCFGVAPGQAVVCFEGDTVLGGGWIQ